jgi:hypothetical protein
MCCRPRPGADARGTLRTLLAQLVLTNLYLGLAQGPTLRH